ncbi:hypothetical protein EYF80_018356 [Liparis tanakae]|uniref:Uncharacterized protein n=1 Tax=Liparis tanakae TaxID=230148 RepID=A0A4Z2I0C0_9TELE|nr:hypothetical protein EYF80_018356 [Liparis tanakae]
MQTMPLAFLPVPCDHACVRSPVPGQILQESLQLIAYQFDQSTFNVVIGHIDHEDVGRGIRQLVVLWEKKAAVVQGGYKLVGPQGQLRPLVEVRPPAHVVKMLEKENWDYTYSTFIDTVAETTLVATPPINKLHVLDQAAGNLRGLQEVDRGRVYPSLPLEGRPSVGRTSVGRTSVDRASGGRTLDGQTSVDRASGGRTSGGRTCVDRASGGRTSVDRASGGRTSVDRASGGRTCVDRASVDRASDGQTSDGQTLGGRTSACLLGVTVVETCGVTASLEASVAGP